MLIKKKHFLLFLICIISLFAFCKINLSYAQLYQSRAEQALLLDMETGTILFEKDADRASSPSLMVQLVTTAIVFDAIKGGEITLDTQFKVSENAWRTGGAPARGPTMFAALGSDIAVADLLRGLIIHTANDAAIVLAEGLSGSEQIFVRRMNRFAEKIGLHQSIFKNASGIYHDEQKMSPTDIARVSKYIIKQHLDLYSIFSEKDFLWNGIRQSNKNPLLTGTIGVDGLKTSYDENSGYGLAASAKQGNRRILVVLIGFKRATDRVLDGRRILEWGFTNFKSAELLPTNSTVGQIKIFGGHKNWISVQIHEPVVALVPKQIYDAKLDGRIVYKGPIKAPIEKGALLAELQIYLNNHLIVSAPLYAQSKITKGNFFSQAYDGLFELLLGWL